MNIGKIVGCGVFDSHRYTDTAGEKISAERVVQSFEFDFILTADKTAASFIDAHSCRLFPGLLILRKPGQISHSILHYRCYCLHLIVEKDSPIYEELASLPDYYTFIHEAAYRALFEELISHLVKVGSAKEDFFSAAKILELVYLLKKDGARNENAREISSVKENRSVQKVIAYIKESFEKSITLSELSALAGYSPNHFQRIFTDIMGISPREYLEEVRIKHAKYLLAQSEKALAEIAQDCGFSSQSYFSKVFKLHTFITPNEFRQNAQFRFLEETFSEP
jgi:AraC-like DNA-binding protein